MSSQPEVSRLYPPEHPAVRTSFDRLSQAIERATRDAVFSIGITPDNLMIEGLAVPTDPFRPQVKIVFDGKGERLAEPFLANTWERDARDEYPRAVVEAVDPEALQIDPLTLM